MPEPKRSRRPKYYNKKITVDGITYDSQKEYARHQELLLLEKAGVIQELRRQYKFLLIPAQYEVTGHTKTGKVKKKCVEREVTYVADFIYWENGKFVVEDVKSEMTRKLPMYVIKRKLMRYIHSIAIKEV